MNEILIIKSYQLKIKKSRKNKREIYERMRLFAAERLALRYRLGEKVGKDLEKECVDVLKNINTTPIQKKAARILLNLKHGKEKTNDIIEKFAIVNDRNDGLVARWRKKVIERDKICQDCGSKNNLEVHHISFWSDDPVNRINIDNGITLCKKCHAERHPENYEFIISKGAKKK